MTETDPRITDFTTCLAARARGLYDGQFIAHRNLLAGLSNGWPVKKMADVCSDKLPPNDLAAAETIRKRLEWYAGNLPAQRGLPGEAAGWCGQCQDPSFRYMVDSEGWPTGKCPRCHPSSVRAARA